MELKNKRIAFMGDSITAGHGVADIQDVYWNLIGRQTGAQVFGYGISGTRIAAQRHRIEPIDQLHYLTRVDDMIPDVDIVVIFGGTNDFGHGDAPLGTISDRQEDTFYGAFHLLIEKLILRYPDAQIVLMTPLHRLGEEDVLRNDRGLRRACPLIRYVEAIREIGQYYGITVVDLFATCPIQPAVELLREKYMPDGLHPNEAGHILLARCLLRTLESL